MKIIFFGTPEFVVPIPQTLLEAGYEITAVVTRTESPVETWAKNHQIPVLTPETLNTSYHPDLGILAAYGKIIPQELIDLFPKGILVIHPSLLPQYRGASPVQAAILAGDTKTGVSIIKMDKEVDHGPIVSQFTEPIRPDDTSETLYARLFQKAADVLVTILPDWVAGKITPREQDHTQATFTHILKREDGHIDLDNPPSPEVFARMVKAYSPWPGVWTRFLTGPDPVREKIIKFLPGEKIQVEGGEPMDIRDFLNGYPQAKKWLSNLFAL